MAMLTMYRHWSGLLLYLFVIINICRAYGPPVVSQRVAKYHTARLGHNTKIPCPAESDSDAYYQWHKDMQIIGGGWERFEVMNKRLRILDVIMEDSGVYRCTVTNGFGSVSVNITLKVIDGNTTANFSNSPGIAPLFVHPEKLRREPILRPVGNDIRLKCKAKGKPRPTITWFKQVDGEWRETQGIKKSQWTLELANLHKEDSGKYMCRAENRVGYVNYTFELKIIERELMLKPELIPPHPVNTTVQFGHTASFQCKVRSEVAPHITWLKKLDSKMPVTQPNQTIEVNGMVLHVLKKGEVWFRKDGSYLNKLTIHNARAEDAGMYVCLGANNRGYNYKEAYLVVTPDPNAKPLDRHTKKVHNSTPLDDISNYSLIIGIPIALLIIIIIIVIVVRQKCTRKPQKTPAKRYAPGTAAGAGTAPTTERMLKNYNSDMHSQSDFNNSSNMQRMYMQTPQHTMYGEC
ncbi:fibroblast growth factor receptor-like 1 [Tubulanus polymorphus]|uniref:fibroblast growth factor receptor-like 1 n=1 Tax=Tubulanus polymorphus TaxID=672921 RepID=UPI003DA475E6